MKILQNYLLLLPNYLIFIKIIKADNAIIDCTNPDSVFSVFNEPIKLSLRGIIKIYENVTIDDVVTTTNNDLSYNYIDARLEYSTSDNHTKNLVIFANKYFENYAKEQTATRITLKIGLQCAMGREKTLVFFQPLEEGNYFDPVFSQLEYELIVPTPIFVGFDLTAFQAISATDDDLTNNQISFTSDKSSALYDIAVGIKNHRATADKKTCFANLIVKRIFMELPQQIQFDIIATDNGIPPRSSKAVIKIRADPLNSLPIEPKFIQTLYKGFIDYDFRMNPLIIELENGTYSKDVRFTLLGKDVADYRLRDKHNGVVRIEWSPKNKDKSIILQRKSWEMELKAQHQRLRQSSQTAILIELADFEGNFHFIDDTYEGFISESGNLYMDVITFNPKIYQEEIEFKVDMNAYQLPIKLKIFKNNITLELLDASIVKSMRTVPYVKLSLQAAWLHLKASTQVIIKIEQPGLDSNHANGNHVEKTVIFKHIEEERYHFGVLNLTFNENCAFLVISQWPEDKEFFYLNESSHSLDLIPIDREDQIFENVTKPRIIIKLKLVCKSLNLSGSESQSSNRFLSRFEEEQFKFNEHDIPYSSSWMWLHLIVDDINDNAPEFQGIKNDLLLAYPAANMPSFMYPEYVIQLNAIDKDIDLNAQIEYKMEDNFYFGIENKTGKIYPIANGLKVGESVNLVIQATDRNGQGLTKQLRLNIIALPEVFYSLLTLTENVKKSVDEITQEFNHIRDLRIQLIKLSYVPRPIKKTPKNANGFMYKAWICAFQDNQPILSKNVKKRLNITADYIINLESFEEINLSHNTNQSSSVFVNYYLVFIICLFIVYSGCMDLSSMRTAIITIEKFQDDAYHVTISYCKKLKISALLIWYFYCTHSALKCNTIPAISSQYLQHNGTNNDTIISATSSSYTETDKANDCLSRKSSQSHIKFNDFMKSAAIEECQ
uniref:Cadherin domain-containing protein n=1 Tax=Glossina palpalis gambiensis TaxID=67801 RepID=A0A1B0B5K0_9MUSC